MATARLIDTAIVMAMLRIIVLGSVQTRARICIKAIAINNASPHSNPGHKRKQLPGLRQSEGPQ
jgi:hypothetical protein